MNLHLTHYYPETLEEAKEMIIDYLKIITDKNRLSREIQFAYADYDPEYETYQCPHETFAILWEYCLVTDNAYLSKLHPKLLSWWHRKKRFKESIVKYKAIDAKHVKDGVAGYITFPSGAEVVVKWDEEKKWVVFLPQNDIQASASELEEAERFGDRYYDVIISKLRSGVLP